ncbi:hypothetical protein D9756_002992 [Leucocoprinus leucothites]|uniref:DUF6593 domain-containing protein n=1 Tax=Leucocoprinus leucothites TaxID=201217 RepID=A0A8H5LJG1_9AGAR|nr:hypothetical protein D9756_002992 [Leucoagaricus leucothites]
MIASSPSHTAFSTQGMIKRRSSDQLFITHTPPHMNFSNNSQTTLVDAGYEGRPALVLELSRYNTTHTVMRQKGGNDEALYNIESDESLSRTSVFHPTTNVPIAVLEFKRLLGKDKITLQGEETKNISDWLSGYGPLQTFPISFKHNGRQYYWKTNFVNQLGLYTDQDSVHPVAWFERHRLCVIDGVLRTFNAFLAMEEEAVEIRDLVVVSFLVAERVAHSSVI